jgi:hypothetical protein
MDVFFHPFSDWADNFNVLTVSIYAFLSGMLLFFPQVSLEVYDS